MSEVSEATKRRVGIAISEEIHERGKRLSEIDRRNFSAELEWLIEQEWRRREQSEEAAV